MSETTSGSVKVGDVDIAYDVRGAGPAVLLVSGFSMTRAMWEPDMCELLASEGFSVVRMDNRDTGASTRLKALGVPDVRRGLVRSMLGLSVDTAYRLEDMADDALGVMTHLGHERFHVVGASMGGMIAQTIALDHPERLLSLTSIMSTPGGRRYSFASPRALGGLLERVPREETAQLGHFMRVFRRIGGAGLPFEEARVRRLVESLVASKPSASGSARQFSAILDSSGRRRARLATLRTPTLIIHGSLDPLLPVRGARAMAKMVPGAQLLIVDKMGHHFHSTQLGQIVSAVATHARNASPRKAA